MSEALAYLWGSFSSSCFWQRDNPLLLLKDLQRAAQKDQRAEKEGVMMGFFLSLFFFFVFSVLGRNDSHMCFHNH